MSFQGNKGISKNLHLYQKSTPSIYIKLVYNSLVECICGFIFFNLFKYLPVLPLYRPLFKDYYNIRTFVKKSFKKFVRIYKTCNGI